MAAPTGSWHVNIRTKNVHVSGSTEPIVLKSHIGWYAFPQVFCCFCKCHLQLESNDQQLVSNIDISAQISKVFNGPFRPLSSKDHADC